MKKMLAMAMLIGVLLAGCSAMSKWTDAQAWCAADAECLNDTKKYAKIGEVVTSPFGPIAGSGAAAAIMFITLGILGLRKKKQ